MIELLFRHRSSLVLLLVWPIVWGTLSQPPAEPWALGVGAACVLAGVGLRLWAARGLGKAARVHRAGVRGQLVRWGPYRWSRNPLYVAAGLQLAGLGLVAGLGPWGLALLPACLLVYTPVVRHEARSIRATTPEYDAYAREVPCWFGLPGPTPEDPGEPVPWSEVLRRERGLVPGAAIALAVIWSASNGLLPVGSWVAQISEAVGARWELLTAVGLALGALANSVGIERKRRRHEARRASQKLEALQRG